MSGQICKSIIVVEDDQAIRTSLSEVLATEGYKVFEAANGKLAFDILNTVPQPSVVLLDLMMPVMNGYDFSEKMKSFPARSEFPIVVMSASRDGEQFAKLNGYVFLKKPIDVDVLLSVIGKHF
jgi:CheY-like chemotaxis protein